MACGWSVLAELVKLKSIAYVSSVRQITQSSRNYDVAMIMTFLQIFFARMSVATNGILFMNVQKSAREKYQPLEDRQYNTNRES